MTELKGLRRRRRAAASRPPLAPSEGREPIGLARNRMIAERLREAAELILGQGAKDFRVRAYHKAAEAIASLDRDIGEIAAGGVGALDAIPGIGPSIAGAVAELLRTGRWAFLERLRGAADPERAFRMIPGVGPGLARTLHETLHVDTLEGLEAAAAAGRLEGVPGLGRRRIAMLRSALAELLARVRPRASVLAEEPNVADMLDVDGEYRALAAADRLPRIAPRRFNPTGEAWLPVLHTRRDPWHFTALYSNTARAHELGRTRDWVVIYFQTDGGAEAQRTVVTEMQGPLRGRRVVRGRERDCTDFYRVRSV